MMIAFTSQVFLLTALTECLFVSSQACNATCFNIVGIMMSDVSDFIALNTLCNIDLVACLDACLCQICLA